MFQTMQQSSSANSNPASSVQKGNAMQAPLMLNTFPWLAYVPRPSTDPHSNAHYPRPLLVSLSYPVLGFPEQLSKFFPLYFY